MPNVMVALPNIGGALCLTPQNLADAHYYMPCSNAAKTWNPLKFAGVPQTTWSISAASGPKFAILWGHVEDILLLRLGEEKKKKKKKKNKRQDENIMVCPIP